MFNTKDSWAREEFSTGSLRDTQEWKPRYDLISTHWLKRLALLMARWADKYWERNWELWQETDRFLASAMRHMFQYAEWDTTEDHLAAVCFNVMGIIHMQEEWRTDMLKNKADIIFVK